MPQHRLRTRPVRSDAEHPPAAEQLSHLDARGQARMVGIGDKPVTERLAVARARVRMRPSTLRLLESGRAAKGDVLAVSRIAGIQAAKRTPELIPLCHAIALTRVEVAFALKARAGLLEIEARVSAHDRTGAEMEALTAASIAALTVYDMLKAVERGIRVEEVVLLEKHGGKSGSWRRQDPSGNRGPGTRTKNAKRS